MTPIVTIVVILNVGSLFLFHSDILKAHVGNSISPQMAFLLLVPPAPALSIEKACHHPKIRYHAVMNDQEVIAYIRPDDGEVFTKRTDGRFQLEKMVRQFPLHLHHTWSEETLKGSGFAPVTQETLELIL